MYYHGTDNDSAEIIVKTQCMNPSVGDHQWLGNGCYFYIDPEYAFRWILIKYTNNFKNEFSKDYSGIFTEYSIVSAELNLDPKRLFCLENIHHKMLFIDTKNALYEKAATSKKYKEIIEKYKIVDGVVFNFLFQYTECGKQYDAIKAVFPISYILDDSRMDFLPEPQICVVNQEIISDFKKYSTDVVPQEYEKFIAEYYKAKYSLKQKRDLKWYKNKKARIKYK